MDGIEALIFDVFGTTVDWRKSVVKELQEIGEKHGLPFSPEDWGDFADEWRVGYMENTRRIAGGGSGTNDVDTMHREILEGMLSSERWSKVGSVLDEPARKHLNFVWHRLEGSLRRQRVLARGLISRLPLSRLAGHCFRIIWFEEAYDRDLPVERKYTFVGRHGEVRGFTLGRHLLCSPLRFLQTASHPNPKTYQGALRHLALSETPHKAAMVAAHIFDLRSAAKVGLKTIYVRRTNEEEDGVKAEDIKSKAEGGEVDVVVNSIEELVHLFANAK
ncbi:haloacid type ii [Moniliophthora roreri]|nr:haloacid type ii [Moniliophthora roreri]